MRLMFAMAFADSEIITVCFCLQLKLSSLYPVHGNIKIGYYDDPEFNYYLPFHHQVSSYYSIGNDRIRQTIFAKLQRTTEMVIRLRKMQRKC